MPSWRMRSWSRISHSKPNSAAIFLAWSASTVGVSTLAGSLAMSRVKFCASARMRPRSRAACDPPSTRKPVDVLFVLLGIGFVAVVFQIGEDRAFHGRGREIVRAKRSSSSARVIVWMPLLLSERSTAPLSLRSSAALKRSRLPPPASTRRLALRPAGRCRTAISSAFPVNSPES